MIGQIKKTVSELNGLTSGETLMPHGLCHPLSDVAWRTASELIYIILHPCPRTARAKFGVYHHLAVRCKPFLFTLGCIYIFNKKANRVVGAPQGFILVDLWDPLRGNRVVGGPECFILVAFWCICGTHYAVTA